MNLIDMHCDTIWKLMETNGTTLNDNPFCIDLQKLKRAESTAQFFACFIYLKQFEGNGRYTKGYDYAMQMLARIKRSFKIKTQSQLHEIFWNLTKIRRRENFPLL